MKQTNPESAEFASEVRGLRQRIKVLEDEAAEHERTRRLLEEDHSFREAVIERTAEGLCVCHAVPEYPFVRFTVWNARMTDLTGYSMEEINRLGWYQTVYADPEIRERAAHRMSQMREGKDLVSEHWEITRADLKKRTLRISTSLLKTSDGLVHVLALMLDVTDEILHRRHLESRVLRLEGLLPICASCKKIRDDTGAWQQLETYIGDHSGAKFTHGICPECTTKLYPDFR